MSDCKKYYYLKIKEDFFESEDIKVLQSLDDGYLFSDILMGYTIYIPRMGI